MSMLCVSVRLPGCSESSVQVKWRGGLTAETVVTECKRKLGVSVPAALCEGDGEECEEVWDVVETGRYSLMPVYPKGTRVRAGGMTKNQELNGQEGHVILQKDGRYGVKFDNGSKGMLTAANLTAVDEKAEIAKEALSKLLQNTTVDECSASTLSAAALQQHNYAPTLTRDQQRALILKLKARYPNCPIRAAGMALVNANWDIDAAKQHLTDEQMVGEKEPEVDEDPSKRNEVAAGGADDPSLRRVAKDDTVGGDIEGTSGLIMYSCRKCRHELCRSDAIKNHSTDQMKGKKEFKKKNGQDRLSFQDCGSIFIEEGSLDWLQDQASADLKGELKCPNEKCNAKIGSYNWTGQQCSCGRWVNPALMLQQSKMDRFAVS